MPCRPLPQPLRAAASSICRVWLPCRTGKVSTTKASAGRRRPLGTAERRAVRILHLLDHSLPLRSEEHTSELQSLMRNSYAVVCLKKKNKTDLHYSRK